MPVRIILVAEAHSAVAHLDEPPVRDGHAMGVPGEVFEDLARPAEGSLGVDGPVGSNGLVQKLLELVRVRERFALTGEV